MIKNAHITNLPDLLEIQRSSFCWFLSEGLAIELNKFSSVLNLDKRLELRIYGNDYKLKKPKFTIRKAKEKTITYSIQVYVSIEVLKKSKERNIQSLSFETQTLEKQKVLIGEIPLMTEKGTFIINGCERVIVNQLVRSPGVYFKVDKKKTKTQSSEIFSATVITQRGSWLTFELNTTKKEQKKEKIR